MYRTGEEATFKPLSDYYPNILKRAFLSWIAHKADRLKDTKEPLRTALGELSVSREAGRIEIWGQTTATIDDHTVIELTAYQYRPTHIRARQETYAESELESTVTFDANRGRVNTMGLLDVNAAINRAIQIEAEAAKQVSSSAT